MSVGTKIKDKLGKIKAHLTSLDNQPLSKAALVNILFLDLFVHTSIFNSLYQHSRQLNTPEEFIPNSCREIVINRLWSATNRMDNLSQIIISCKNAYYRIEEKTKVRHPATRLYFQRI